MLVSRRAPGAFPWGTFAVNVSGAFVLGFVFTVMTEQFTVAPWIRGAVTIGLLGAYTTFSTLSFESYRLLEDATDVAGRSRSACSSDAIARSRLPSAARQPANA